MQYEVLLTSSAERDLEELYDYIAEFDSPAKAEYVLKNLAESMESLASFPERGTHPKELLILGIREYHQILFKPYRVIYRIIDKKVFIYLIADGRRDMQTLLLRRMISQ